MPKFSTTDNAKKGGLFVGPSHDDGGIKAIVTDTNQPIEVEGGEVIINKEASKLHCKELSRINQSAGGGVPIPCNDISDAVQEVKDHYAEGGPIQLAFDFDNLPPAVQKGMTEEVNSKEVEKMIVSLREKYNQQRSFLLSFKENEKERQRSETLKWILNPENKVKVIIAFSGGKDSVAMVLRCLFEWKIPKDQIELWHHDVDGDGMNLFDWECTKSYCEAFANHFGLKLLYSFSGGGILGHMMRENEPRKPMYFQSEPGGEFLMAPGDPKFLNTMLKFPAIESSLRKRWCSSVAKIEVMSRAINNIPGLKEQNICIMTGERRQESKARAKYKEFDLYAEGKTRGVQITWRSIIDMEVDEIWALYEKHKIQPHPCYELGWPRCSCQLCIFNKEQVWATIQEISPEKIEFIAALEEKFGMTLKMKYRQKNKVKYVVQLPIKEYAAKGKSFLTPENQKWVEQATGQFTAPIIVENWKLPAGAYSTVQAGAK